MDYMFPAKSPYDDELPFVITGCARYWEQEDIERSNGYNNYQWLHCARGSGLLKIGGEEFVISEGHGFFFSPGIPHSYYSMTKPWITKWITFKGHSVSSVLSILKIGEWGVFDLKNLRPLDIIMNDIELAITSGKPHKTIHCSSLLYSMLVKLKSLIELNDNKNTDMYSRLQPVISWLDKEYRADVSLPEMSRILDVSPHYLCRLFKSTMNTTPFKYLTTVRIQKAKELLIRDRKLTVNKIAQECGYNDCSYFCLVFKKNEGITPNEFRRMHC